MSLKAKIEAVIYASEEPVTLAQLTGLLGLEGQAELDALDAKQQSLALEEEQSNPQPSGEEHTEPETVIETPDVEATPDEEADEAESSAEATSSGDKKLARERERRLREHFRTLLDSLIADYANDDRGLEIREVANGFRLATKPEYHDAVRGFVKSLKPPLKLSLQALETLAVIAYKQPVTAPEISEIRGVDTSGVLGSLMTRKLIQTGGRKQVIGRPILYKTTKEFLLRFGLKDISELPSIEEFEKMAGELNDAVQEEMQMEEHINTSETSEAETRTGSPNSLDEKGATPEPTNVFHETVEDLESDKSTHPEGAAHEGNEEKPVAEQPEGGQDASSEEEAEPQQEIA